MCKVQAHFADPVALVEATWRHLCRSPTDMPYKQQTSGLTSYQTSRLSMLTWTTETPSAFGVFGSSCWLADMGPDSPQAVAGWASMSKCREALCWCWWMSRPRLDTCSQAAQADPNIHLQVLELKSSSRSPVSFSKSVAHQQVCKKGSYVCP